MALQICSCACREREDIPALTSLSPKLVRYTSRMHMDVGVNPSVPNQVVMKPSTEQKVVKYKIGLHKTNSI